MLSACAGRASTPAYPVESPRVRSEGGLHGERRQTHASRQDLQEFVRQDAPPQAEEKEKGVRVGSIEATLTPFLEHHDHHRVGAQFPVEGIELLARRGADYASDAQIFPALARFHFHRRAIEIRRMALDDLENRLREARAGMAEDLDRKVAGLFDQRSFAHAARRITSRLNSW